MATQSTLEQFEELARERAGGVVSLHLAWSTALKKLGSTQMNEANIKAVASVCRAPRDAELAASLVGAIDNADDLLEQAQQESSYPLGDVFSGVLVLCRHLDRDRRQTSLKMALGFVRCCEESTASYPALDSLGEVVERMLEEHGFEG